MGSVTQYILGWNAAAVICLIVGMLLMIYEMFTPGMGFPALFGAIALIAAIILRADSVRTALITLVIIIVPLIIAAAIIFHSFSKGALSRSPIVLKDAIDSQSSSLSDADMQSLVGAEGVCLTALRPAGNAEFGDRRLDVLSDGEFIAKGAKVRIVRIEGLKIMVREA